MNLWDMCAWKSSVYCVAWFNASPILCICVRTFFGPLDFMKSKYKHGVRQWLLYMQRCRVTHSDSCWLCCTILASMDLIAHISLFLPLTTVSMSTHNYSIHRNQLRVSPISIRLYSRAWHTTKRQIIFFINYFIHFLNIGTYYRCIIAQMNNKCVQTYTATLCIVHCNMPNVLDHVG